MILKLKEMWDVQERNGRCEFGTDQRSNPWKERFDDVFCYRTKVLWGINWISQTFCQWNSKYSYGTPSILIIEKSQSLGGFLNFCLITNFSGNRRLLFKLSFRINSKFTTLYTFFSCSNRTTRPTHRNHFDSTISTEIMYFGKSFVSVIFL